MALYKKMINNVSVGWKTQYHGVKKAFHNIKRIILRVLKYKGGDKTLESKKLP